MIRYVCELAAATGIDPDAIRRLPLTYIATLGDVIGGER